MVETHSGVVFLFGYRAYIAQRALVRSSVSFLRAGQGDASATDRARSFLALTRRHVKIRASWRTWRCTKVVDNAVPIEESIAAALLAIDQVSIR